MIAIIQHFREDGALWCGRLDRPGAHRIYNPMAASPRARILLIEDNDADVFMIRKALQANNLDCEIIRFEDGNDARVALSSQEEPPLCPDLILLDLNTPPSDGIDTLREIRSTPRLVDVPVAILTPREVRAISSVPQLSAQPVLSIRHMGWPIKLRLLFHRIHAAVVEISCLVACHQLHHARPKPRRRIQSL